MAERMTADAVSIVADTLRNSVVMANFPADWPEKTAEAVVDALGGLEREWAVRTGFGDLVEGVDQDTALYVNEQDNDGGEGLGRWVSGWLREPAEEEPPQVPCESQPCDVLVPRGGSIDLCPTHRAEFNAWVAAERETAQRDEAGR